MFPQAIALDPTLHSQEVLDIKQKLLTRTIGQNHAVGKLAMILETYKAGYNDPKRPVGVVLELGLTGTGKTRCVRPAGPKTPRAHAAGDLSLTLHQFTRPRTSRALRCSATNPLGAARGCSVSGPPARPNMDSDPFQRFTGPEPWFPAPCSAPV